MAVTPTDHQRSFDERVAPMATDAARRVRGFRTRLEDAGLAPADLVDVASLDRLPVMSKDALLAQQQADPPFGGLLADDVRVRRVFQSPGPLYEPDTGRSDAWRWQPALEAVGIGAGTRVLVAFGYHLSPAGAMFEDACLAAGATVLPGGVGNKDLQVAACRDLGVTAFIGPPSYLKALLDTAEEADVALPIERALVSAEPLPPSLRAWLDERVAVVRQAYGTAECGHLGFECEAVEGLHVPEDVLVQVCDLTTGEARTHGQGQVVVTAFGTDYPLVRFGTGDLSSWLSDPCACGRAAPRIAGWQGRVGDAVKVRGMFLHPAQVAGVLGRLDDVAAYRVVVDREDHRDVVRCEVVASDRADGGAGQLAEHVRTAMRDGLRFSVEVTVVDDLPEDAPAFEDVRTWD
jgi:phenylacetate-CoA ligase